MEKLNLTDTIMYDALLAKDSQFEGLFFVGVRTTGIFCRPTCTARKPKRENVEFFRAVKEALTNGYRPCKVCRPLDSFGESPREITSLLCELHEEPSKKISDAIIRARGIEPSKVRRWFQKHHGMTFQSYQRMLRINAAFGMLTDGSRVIDAALDSGYESLSGFQDAFKKATRHAPIESKGKATLSYERFPTPLGVMIAVATGEGVCVLEFADRRMLETELKQVRAHFGCEILPGTNEHIADVKRQLEEYFQGERKSFNLSLVTPGTQFQNEVWRALREIPYGATRSYKQQAIAIGTPSAVRAVAHANGCNRISIVIPCHRVIGEDGHLTGYGGGLWRKQWLLEHERDHL